MKRLEVSVQFGLLMVAVSIHAANQGFLLEDRDG